MHARLALAANYAVNFPALFGFNNVICGVRCLEIRGIFLMSAVKSPTADWSRKPGKRRNVAHSVYENREFHVIHRYSL